MAATSVRSAGLCIAFAACLTVLASVHSRGASRQSVQPLQHPQATFTAGVDVVEMDVSVLDRNHKPVRGLTAKDFTILEDGKPQKIVAFSEEHKPSPAPPSAPWMRDVPPDVESNAVAEKQLFVIVLDDATLSPAQAPPNQKPTGLGMSGLALAGRGSGGGGAGRSGGGGGARGGGGDSGMDVYRLDTLRKAALRAIDLLGDGDMAAVVFANDGFKGQSFTADRSKLIAAVNSVTFGPVYYVSNVDPTQTDCQPLWYTTGALRSAVEALSSVPHGRKTVLYVSIGLDMPITGRPPHAYEFCASRSQNDLLEVFRMAQLANVNVYAIDPSGLQVVANNQRHNFLMALAANTGGRAVVDTNDDVGRVEGILQEVRSYYLIGYEMGSRKSDGRFHRVEVKVDRPAGAAVHSRQTRYDSLPPKSSPTAVPAPEEIALADFMPKTELFAEATLAPFESAGGKGTVLVTVAGRLPALSAPLTSDHIDVLIRAFTPDGRAMAAHQEIVPVSLHEQLPGASSVPGSGPRFELASRLDLAPGRYSLRIAVHSAAIDKTGSVYTDVVVPDFSHDLLSLSGVVFTSTPPSSLRGDVLSSLQSTTIRAFGPTDSIEAFLRVYQGGTSAPSAVTLRSRIVDEHNAEVVNRAETLPAQAFSPGRQADFRYRLPLSTLKPGQYWLSIEAAIGRLVEKRDLRFSVK